MNQTARSWSEADQQWDKLVLKLRVPQDAAEGNTVLDSFRQRPALLLGYLLVAMACNSIKASLQAVSQGARLPEHLQSTAGPAGGVAHK